MADQEASVRAMLAFVGEPFDKACLTFHKNRRYARTASYAQVTEPLYERSVYRYRHYRTASRTGDADPAAGDRAARLYGGLMETPAPAPRAPAPGTVPLPIGEVLRDRQRVRARRPAGRCQAAARPYPCALRRTRAMRCILPASSRSGRATSRKSLELMERSLDVRHRYAAVPAQHLRGLSRAGAAGRGAGDRAARHGAGAGRSAVPA